MSRSPGQLPASPAWRQPSGRSLSRSPASAPTEAGPREPRGREHSLSCSLCLGSAFANSTQFCHLCSLVNERQGGLRLEQRPAGLGRMGAGGMRLTAEERVAARGHLIGSLREKWDEEKRTQQRHEGVRVLAPSTDARESPGGEAGHPLYSCQWVSSIWVRTRRPLAARCLARGHELHLPLKKVLVGGRDTASSSGSPV